MKKSIIVITASNIGKISYPLLYYPCALFAMTVRANMFLVTGSEMIEIRKIVIGFNVKFTGETKMKSHMILLVITFFIANAQILENFQSEVKNDELIEMIFVKGGAYQIKLKSIRKIKDTYDYNIRDLFVGKYEVTQAQYFFIMGSNPSHFIGDNLPVEKVSFYDAIEFCNKLSDYAGFEKCYITLDDSVICDFSAKGYRLPKEAERYFIAKGGNNSKNFKYSGSDIIDEVAEYRLNNDKSTKVVGGKNPNELGIYDMSGNVAEWCWDLYLDTPVSILNNGNVIAKKKGRRVMCGGGYCSREISCQVENSNGRIPENKTSFWGFRVVRNAE